MALTWKPLAQLAAALLLTSLCVGLSTLMLFGGSVLASSYAVMFAVLGFAGLLLWVLPILVWARSRQRASIWLAMLSGAIFALAVGLTWFYLVDWGTHGYTDYGVTEYRLVAEGRLTTAGVIVWAIRMMLAAAMGAAAGALFWWSGAGQLAIRRD